MYEWLRFLRQFKIRQGEKKLADWARLMIQKAEVMVVKQQGSIWRDDGQPAWEPLSSNRPASHIVTEVMASL